MASPDLSDSNHHETHEPGGVDEVHGVAPGAHAASHLTGNDQIADATGAAHGLMPAAHVTKLAGIEANADVTSAHAPKAHAASHVTGGDAIGVAGGGSAGLMSDAHATKLAVVEAGADVTANHAPKAHAASHAHDGADPIARDLVDPEFVVGWFESLGAPPGPGAGEATIGSGFRCLQPCSILGGRFGTGVVGAHVQRFELWWFPAGGGAATLLKSVDVNCSGPGFYDAVFASDYVVDSAHLFGAGWFVVSTYETTATYYTVFGVTALPTHVPAWFGAHMVPADKFALFYNGHGAPNAQAGSERYAVSPLVVYRPATP